MLMVVQSLPLLQVAGSDKARFDLAKFAWLGNMSDSANTVLAWRTAGVKSLDDARRVELLMGSTTAASLGGIYPAIMNKALGTKFRIIHGYESGDAIDLALERGEVNARVVSWAALKAYRASWLRDGLVNIFAQVGLRRESDLDAPLLTELATNEGDREVLAFYSSLVAFGRAVTLGPGVPPERVEILRRAFDAAMADPALIAEADRQGLELRALDGARVQEIVTGMVRADARRMMLERGMVE
jgi:ABC-type amino acid transport substrate-binding protein